MFSFFSSYIVLISQTISFMYTAFIIPLALMPLEVVVTRTYPVCWLIHCLLLLLLEKVEPRANKLLARDRVQEEQLHQAD